MGWLEKVAAVEALEDAPLDAALVAGSIGSRIFAWQCSQSSAQAPAVTEKAGKLFLPQPSSSQLE